MQFGCPETETSLYVAPLEGIKSPVENRRGGIVAYVDPTRCNGLVDTAACFMDGITQSFDKLAHPDRQDETMMSFAILTVLGVGISLFFAAMPRSKEKSKAFFKGLSYSK